MKKFAAYAVAASLFVLAACDDSPPEPVPTVPGHPGENPDCKYETQAGDCVPAGE